MYEPLILGFIFPVLSHTRKLSKWKIKGTVLVERAASKVHGIQSAGRKVDGNLLWKLLDEMRNIPSIPDGVAQELLQDSYI